MSCPGFRDGSVWDPQPLWEYNLFSHQRDREHPQDHNLLYIGPGERALTSSLGSRCPLTRSQERLTLLLNRCNARVASPFIPLELMHYATELWADEHG